MVVVAEHGWWYPEVSTPDHGWDISNINMLTDNSHESMDPVMGATNLRVLLCNLKRCKEQWEDRNGKMRSDYQKD
jgi:hypothetical protein